MAHDIFISYSHKDKTTADAICSHLESRGMRVWYAPRDITPGEEWGNAILKGIEEARIMVLVFTRDANLSQQVLREVNNAVNSGLAIIPFRLTEEEPAAGMRYYLSTVHWMDAMNQDLEIAISSLGDLCQAVLEKKVIPPTAVPPAGSGTGKGTSGRKKAIAAVAAVLGLAVIGGAVWVITRPKGESYYVYDTDENTVVYERDDDDGGAKIEHDHSDEVLDIGAVSENVVHDYSVSYTDGNNQNNILNDGHLAFDGEYYYYTGNDGDHLHKMSADGSADEVLVNKSVKWISVYDGYVYFVSDSDLYRVKTDGSDLKLLIEYSAYAPRICSGRIYYGEFKLFSCALDGSDEREENGIDAYDVLIDGTYTYYIDPNHSSHIYRARMDGSEAVCIYDKKASSLRLAGDLLVFYDSENNWCSSYDLSTGEVTQLTYDPVNSPVLTADGFYGSSGSLQLVFVPFGKIGLKLLTEDQADTVNVAGNKIFFRNCVDDKYYIMDLDGSNMKKL